MSSKLLLFSFLFFWAMQFSFAQSASLSGKISNGEDPVAYAIIRIDQHQIWTEADARGEFLLEGIPTGTQEVKIIAMGFESKILEITFKDGDRIDRDIDLQSKSRELEEVVVSGTLSPMSKLESPVPVEVYSQTFFKSNPTPSIFESLQNVNGVRPQLNCNVCNTGDIHINGLEGPYTMVLIDGMPIVSGLATVYGLMGIPQSLIERVEVVKGPASTLYGSEAVGGLINIITKKPGNAPLFSIDVMGTSWQEYNLDLAVGYSLSPKVNALLGVNYFNYSNPIDNNRDGFTDLTLQDRISVFQKLDIARESKKEFSLAGRFVYEDRWGGEMDWNPEFRGGDQIYGESIYTNRWEAFGVYQLPTAEELRLQFSANGHHQNSVYGNTIYNADQHVAFGQLTWHKRRNAHAFLAGAVYRYTRYDDDTPATFDAGTNSNNVSESHLPGLFLQDEITINESNKVLLGMRYDYNSLHGNILTPRINYKWSSPDNKNIIRLSAGNGYRVANVFTEDHAALTGARTVEFEGELQPESSWNANFNLVKRIYFASGSYLSFDASAFYTYFSNRIIPDYETDANKIIYANLDGFSISQGASLNIDLSLKNGIKILTGATIMDVSIEENGERQQQLLTESFQGVWTISYPIHRFGMSIDYTGNLYGPMRLPLLGPLDNRPEYSPWFSIQNIQLTKIINDQWRLYGGVKNLLDFTPPSNSIARAFDPFDENVEFDANGQVIPTANNPNALSFDPSYVFVANQGIRFFFGVQYSLQ